MAYFRLNENHPASKALQQVFAKMEEVGISIDIDTYGKLTVNHENRQFTLMDNESPLNSEDVISILPPMFAYKLIYEVEEKE